MPDWEQLAEQFQKLLSSGSKELPAVTEAAAQDAKQLPTVVSPSDGLPAVSVKDPDAVVGQGTSSASPSDLPVQDADLVTQQGNQGPNRAALPSPDVAKWTKMQKLAALAAAGGAGAAGLAAAGAFKGKDGDNSATPPSKPKSVVKPSIPDEEEDEDDDEDETPSKSSAKVAVSPSAADDMIAPDQGANIKDLIAKMAGGYNNIGSLADFQKVLQQTQENQNANNSARAATAAIANQLGKQNYFEPMLKDREKQIAQAPQQYMEQVAAQAIDPKSQISQVYRDVAQKYGLDAPDGASASDLKTLFPQLESFKQHEDATAMRQLVAQGNQQTRQMQFADLAQRRQQAQDQHNIDKQNASYNNTVQLLEQARGAPDFAQAEKDIYATGKINTLMNTVGNPNKLNPQMAHLLASEVSKVASGGTSSIAELNALNPSTLSSKFADALQTMTSKPTPANVGALLKNYQNYANDISKTAQQLVNERYNRIIGSRGSQFTDDQNDFLNKYYTNRFANQPGIQPAKPNRSIASTPAVVPQAASDNSGASQTVVMKGPGGVFNVPVTKKQKFLDNGYTEQ